MLAINIGMEHKVFLLLKCIIRLWPFSSPDSEPPRNIIFNVETRAQKDAPVSC